MNLHIVPDSVFVNKFIDNLRETGVSENNRFVVRTNQEKLRLIKHDIPFARLYSRHFDSLIGSPKKYKNVFVHQFTPLLYRWIATNEFSSLGWMVWGADLYNLPELESLFYETITLNQFVQRRFSIQKNLYRFKVSMLHGRFKSRAYSQVDSILTWMTSEYDFAVKNLPGVRAKHLFFFYENEVPYREIDGISVMKGKRERPLYVLGNSSTPELNHVDAVHQLQSMGERADLIVPVSYGDKEYRKFLMERLSSYKNGSIRFLRDYMPFPEYLQLLSETDGLIMNNVRPQGYGNILMMMYMGKRVFLNDKNISIPDLNRMGLIWKPLSQIGSHGNVDWESNKARVTNLLSHEGLLETYRELFG